MKALHIAILFTPLFALNARTPLHHDIGSYKNAEIFIEGRLSGKVLEKVKVSTEYQSTSGKGNNQFYILTELIVDGRIQFNGQIIAPDGYIEVGGQEKEFYKVYAKDGAHLNKGNVHETKAWFVSRSALPNVGSKFCFGALQIDYAEKNIPQYMTQHLGAQDTSQNIRVKEGYIHTADLLLAREQVSKISLEMQESGTQLSMYIDLSPHNIAYQIRKNPQTGEKVINDKPIVDKTSFNVYLDDILIGQGRPLTIVDPTQINTTILRFKSSEHSDMFERLSQLIDR